MTERMENAIETCGKIEYSVNGKNYSDLDNACGLFQMTAEQELKNGKTESEVLIMFGNTIQESVAAYISSEQSMASEKADMDFLVVENGLSFYLQHNGVGYGITEDIDVATLIRDIMTLETEMDITDIASPELIDAISLCEDIDISLNGEPEMSAYYSKMTEQELRDGKSENEILHSLGEAIRETFNMYVEEQSESADEKYEKDVYSDSYLDFSIEDGKLNLSLECCDKEYDIKDGYAVTDILYDAIDEAREEYEAEHEEESEYDD